MRVALLALDYPPYRSSGLTIYAESVAQGLVGRGHSVSVITSSRSVDRWTGGVPAHERVRVERLPVGPLDWVGFGWQAARYLRVHSPEFDVIHFMDVHFAYAYTGDFTASVLQSFRQRLTSSPRGPYNTGWRDYLFRITYYTVARFLMERTAVRRARHLVATSESTRREFCKYYGVEQANISLVPIGVDLSRFGDSSSSMAARRQLRLPLEGRLLLYVGFSTPRKGVEYLARALRTMRTKPHLVMVGKWESGYRDRFTEALGDAVSRVIITGYVSDDELVDYYAAADVFVLPTLLEGFGIPLVEAMAAGLPIVTTTGGAAAEVVGDAGLSVLSADSEALAQALDQVLCEPGLAARLGATGRKRALAFGSDRISARFESALLSAWSK